MSIFCLLLICLIPFSHSLGSWGECTDLKKVKADVDTIGNEIRALLVASGDEVSSTDTLDITSAQCQLVAGMNYQVTLNIASFESVTVQYFIGLPVNGTYPAPTTLQVKDLGYGLITDADDLTEVQATVLYLDDDIRTLLLQDAFEISDSSPIKLLSARSQATGGGATYKIRINIASYHDIILSYVVPPAILIRGVPQNNPTDLRLLDGGYRSIDDLSEVEAVVQYLDSDIRSLLNKGGLSSIDNSSQIKVQSAASRVESGGGSRYNVSLNVGAYKDVIISYYVGLPLLVHGAPQNNPTDLQLLHKGYRRVADEDLSGVQVTVESIANDIRLLLTRNGLTIGAHSTIVVTSAESQVEINVVSTYRVTINVASYTDVIISYTYGYIGPFLLMGGPLNYPTNLRLIDAGTQRVMTGALGAYKAVEDLDAIRRDVVRISETIRSLLGSEGLVVSDEDRVSVVSAQSQVVAGMNYRVTLCVGSHKDVIVQYFVDLFVNDETQAPKDLQLIDLGCVDDADDAYDGDNSDSVTAGAYHTVNDLSQIKSDVARIADDIIALLNDESGVNREDAIVVISAESQVVAGMNYRVRLTVGSRVNVVIQYFIDLPSNDPDGMPQHLRLIDAGQSRNDLVVGSYRDVKDLDAVKADVARIENDIRALLKSNGLTVDEKDEIKVKSAQSQVVAGMNYQVSIDVANRYFNVVIQYFIDLPTNDEAQMPKYLKVIDVGTESNEVKSNEITMNINNNRVTVLIIVAVALGLCVIAFIVAFVVCLRKKRTKHDELYAKLNGGDCGDAIDANL